MIPLSPQPADFAVDLAHQAGKLISTNFTMAAERTWKADGTPLTATDTAVNAMVIDAVRRTFPTHAVIGEEESLSGDSEWAWVCDPIDGTIPFAHGIPLSTFCLALCRDGEPELAVVLDPFLGRLFVAEKGSGATLNGEPIHVSDSATVGSTLIAAGDSTTRARLGSEGAWLLHFESYVYGAMLVACGQMSAAMYIHRHPWDGAASALIVSEAGGQVTSLKGRAQRYDGAIDGQVVSNGLVHEAILDAVGCDSR